MKKLALFFALISGSVMAAEPDGPHPKGSAYLEPAGGYWGDTWVATSADTDYVLSTIPGGAINLCIPFGSQVMLMAEGGKCEFTWTQTASITYDNASGGAGNCDVSDAAGPDGRGACVHLKDGIPVNQVPTIKMFDKTRIGRRHGVCSASVYPWTEATSKVFPPCGVNDDCTNASAWNISGATCDTTISAADRIKIQKLGCAGAVFQCDTDATAIHIGIEE